MNIPRLTKGPPCYTLERWVSHMAVGELCIGIFLAILAFYYNSFLQSFDIDEDVKQSVSAVLIVVGIFFCINALVAGILIAGILLKKKKFLLVWCFYSMVGCVLFLLIVGGLGIFCIVIDIGQYGAYLIIIAVIKTAHHIYAVIAVHSIYMNIKEAEENNISHAQQS